MEKLGKYLWSDAGQERILATYLELGCRTLPAEGGLVALLEGDGPELLVGATFGACLAGMPIGTPLLKDRLPALALTQGRTLWVADASRDPRCSLAEGARYGIALRDLICVPLIVGGRRLGVYVFLNKIGGTFTEAEAGLVESGGWLTGSAVCYAQLYETESRNRRLAQTLSAFSMAITQSLNVDIVLGVLLSYLRQLVPYDRATAMLVEWDSRFVVRAVQGSGGTEEAVPGPSDIVDARHADALRGLLEAQVGTVLDDLRSDPSLASLPFTEELRSWMAIPLVASGRVIGMYTLGKSTPGYYSKKDLHLAETLASQASAAVQSAWLFERVGEGRARLQALSRQLVQAQEEERRAVSRELHDEAGQSLASLKLSLHLLEKKAEDPEAVRGALSTLRQQLDGIMTGLHRLASNLRPAALDHVGLAAAIQQMADSLSEGPGPRVENAGVHLGEKRLPEFTETALYRIVQEAVSNARAHSCGTRVWIRVERVEGKIRVLVEDDGMGFDPLVAHLGGRLGLLGMKERAEMLGGSLRLESVQGKGTSVLVEVPDAHPDSSGR